jgi:16S rRNA processing protein RimM
MEKIKIGVIANTHGLRGTLKVKSFTDFKEQRYKKGNTLYILFKNEYIKVTVKKYKTVKTVEHIDFDELTHINQVEKYKGSSIYMDADQKHELPEDEFYFDELVGMEVFTDKSEGIVKEVMSVPRGEMLVVEREHKKRALIPFLKHFIKEVDKENKIIYINEVEGLL